jgi:hypothetical protein
MGLTAVSLGWSLVNKQVNLVDHVDVEFSVKVSPRILQRERLRVGYIQGGALNRGLKRLFSLYRPSCHIEAYIRPENYCFVWAGPLANHHSILTSFS